MELIEDRVAGLLAEGPATAAELAQRLGEYDAVRVCLALAWLEGAHKAHAGDWGQAKKCVRLWHAGPHPKAIEYRRGPVRVRARKLAL